MYSDRKEDSLSRAAANMLFNNRTKDKLYNVAIHIHDLFSLLVYRPSRQDWFHKLEITDLTKEAEIFKLIIEEVTKYTHKYNNNGIEDLLSTLQRRYGNKELVLTNTFINEFKSYCTLVAGCLNRITRGVFLDYEYLDKTWILVYDDTDELLRLHHQHTEKPIFHIANLVIELNNNKYYGLIEIITLDKICK